MSINESTMVDGAFVVELISGEVIQWNEERILGCFFFSFFFLFSRQCFSQTWRKYWHSWKTILWTWRVFSSKLYRAICDPCYQMHRQQMMMEEKEKFVRGLFSSLSLSLALSFSFSWSPTSIIISLFSKNNNNKKIFSFPNDYSRKENSLWDEQCMN